MASQSEFDQLLRQEIRSRGSRGGETDTQAARDAVARRLNVRSGKNPNPRTSTAYKPTPDRPAGQTGSGKRTKGGRGVPTPRPRPGGGGGGGGLPDTGVPTPTPRPDGAPDSGGGSGIWNWLLPILLGGAGIEGARRLLKRGGPGETAAAADVAGEQPRQMTTTLSPEEQRIVDAQYEVLPDQQRISGPDAGGKQLPAPLSNIDQFVQDSEVQAPQPQLTGPSKAPDGRDYTADELAAIQQRMYPNGGTGFNDLHPRIKTPGFYRGFK